MKSEIFFVGVLYFWREINIMILMSLKIEVFWGIFIGAQINYTHFCHLISTLQVIIIASLSIFGNLAWPRPLWRTPWKP